jgi:uncharacterized protein (DUF302 family)
MSFFTSFDQQSRAVMITTFTVQHYEHATDRSFEEVVAAFESATGSVEKGELNAAIREAKSLSEFEAKVRAFESESGFMRFMTADHAGWLRHFGVKAKARTYALGNPLIAWTMLKYDLGAGLNVPVRLMIYEDSFNKVRLVYDLPSSLMSGLGNEELMVSAQKLDEKLRLLAERSTAAAA